MGKGFNSIGIGGDASDFGTVHVNRPRGRSGHVVVRPADGGGGSGNIRNGHSGRFSTGSRSCESEVIKIQVVLVIRSICYRNVLCASREEVVVKSPIGRSSNFLTPSET